MPYTSFVGGGYAPATTEARALVDPATEEPFAEICDADIATTRRAIDAAREAFDNGPWRSFSPSERRAALERVVAKLAERAGDLAEVERRNAGVTIRVATAAHIGQSIVHLDHFARAAERPTTESLPIQDVPPAMRWVVREPVGVCAAIVPWNAPLLTAIWKVGSALATGNTVVLKPAPNTPLTALALAEICAESGIPPGVVNVVTGGADVGEELASNPKVDLISFTGSTVVGRRIAELAAPTMKKVGLELGGKSANIILEDADLDLAVEGSLFAILVNSGQACTSGTRLLVPRALRDEVIERMVSRLAAIRIGDTADWDTDMGPLISAQHRQRIEDYVALAQTEGAKPVWGAQRPAAHPRGYFYEPTVFVEVSNSMRIAREEVFGPVLAVIDYRSEAEAIAIANDSEYGLAGGLWTTDIERGLELAGQIRSGTVWVNDYHTVSPDAPFGGYKQSGLGRELGDAGLDHYTELKTVHVNLAPREARLYGAVVPEPQ